MADTSGQAEIRGIDIDKLAKGFADEETIFKKFVTVTPTSAREIRWYSKTSGFLTATAPADIANVAFGAQPFVLEQSWTRTTSYVRKYFVESPILSDEDIRDSDIDILATNVRDLTRAVEYKVDGRIWDILSDNRTGVTNINWLTCSGAWSGDGTTANPIQDIMNAKQKIRADGYNPENGILALNSISHKNLLSWLINIKGSSIPAFASAKLETGVVMEILGLRVTVSENVTSNFGLVGDAKTACTWKQFTPITAVSVVEPLIGTKIRIAEEGEAILHDGNALCLLSGCGTV